MPAYAAADRASDRNPAGPVDPQVYFIALREPGGKLIALYLATRLGVLY